VQRGTLVGDGPGKPGHDGWEHPARLPLGLIGQSIRRLEDVRFLTGRGRYVADIDFVRQPHAVRLRAMWDGDDDEGA
jgi:hypothetical protein